MLLKVTHIKVKHKEWVEISNLKRNCLQKQVVQTTIIQESKWENIKPSKISELNSAFVSL